MTTAVAPVQTKSSVVLRDIAAMMLARNSLIWIVTGDERRVEIEIFKAAKAVEHIARTWDVGRGVVDVKNKPVSNATAQGEWKDPQGADMNFRDPGEMMNLIRIRAGLNPDREPTNPSPGVWIMRDMHKWIDGPGKEQTQRLLRNLATDLPDTPLDNSQLLVIISPSGDVPAELSNLTTVVEWPLPDRIEIGMMLDTAVTNNNLDTLVNGVREAAISAAVGLSGEEAEACFARSIIQMKAIDPHVIAQEKKRVIAKEGLLEWIDPLADGLDAVGGLEHLKHWIVQRKSAFSARAREYGLPRPKGILLCGIPGCGKSLIAKATATGFEIPLLRLDLGALKSKYVGESESNLRKMFKVVEAIGDCVLWIDEIEKALAGASSEASDGGVSADALGAILSWMQDRRGGAFVIMTANDAGKLPPELIRKGRLDEVFWVELPTPSERKAIMAAALREHDRSETVDLDKIARETKQYTGAEIAALVSDALFTAFNDGERPIDTMDIIEATEHVHPLAVTAQEKFDKLRAQFATRARPASLKEPEYEDAAAATSRRQLNVDLTQLS